MNVILPVVAVSFLIAILLHLYFLINASGLTASISPLEQTLLEECHSLRGHGIQYYATLPGARQITLAMVEDGELYEEDMSCGAEIRNENTTVVHCCTLGFEFQGRSGNILTQYIAGRFFAEINSCAMPNVPFISVNSPHNEMGSQGGTPESISLQWPPVQGYKSSGSGHRLQHGLDAYGYHRVPATYDITFSVYPEYANWLYSALSLGWDLAGDTLMGRGVRGLNQVLMSGNATAERAFRWAKHREVCAQAGVQMLAVALVKGLGSEDDVMGSEVSAEVDAAVSTVLESLHPWLASQLVTEVQGLLQGTHPRMSEGLRALFFDPERTMVIHIRVGDTYRGAFHEALVRGSSGIVHRGGSGDLGWLGSMLFLSDKIDERNAVPPSQHLEMLEGNAALAGGIATPPLSFFQNILRGTREAWDTVIVVGDSTLQYLPLFTALQEEFGAVLQSGYPALDMATLLLARQLVISGGSTFSFMAAAQGRARVIHAPHLSLMSTRTWTGTCFITPHAYDPRWVFHDVFRAAVRRVARGFAAQSAAARKEGLAEDAVVTREWALAASAGVWQEHVEFRRQPLLFSPPVWDEDCPPDAEGNGKGYERAIGITEVGGDEGDFDSEDEEALAPMPLYFLTYKQLVEYYRRPSCSRFFFPSYAKVMEENHWPIGEKQWNTCVDQVPLAPFYDGKEKGTGCRLWGQNNHLCEGRD